MTDLLRREDVLELVSAERAEHEKLYAAYMKQGRRNFALQHETVAAILGIVTDRIRALPPAQGKDGEVERGEILECALCEHDVRCANCGEPARSALDPRP